MSVRLIHFLSKLSLLFLLLPVITHGSTQLQLTEAEHDWIKQHPVIQTGGLTDFAPFEFSNNKGCIHGLSINYLELISERTGYYLSMTLSQAGMMNYKN